MSFYGSKHAAGEPTPFSAAERQGPFARIVNGFDGLPLGWSLRTILDEAWDFDAIPRRTKALVAAVIARGLGDRLVLSEARALARYAVSDEVSAIRRALGLRI